MQANITVVAGNLVRDVELRYTPNGKAVCNLNLAINNTYGKGEEKKQDTVFMDVVVWNGMAEACNNYISKGSPIYVEGRLSQESWEDKEGKKRSKIKIIATRVQFLGPKKEEKEIDIGEVLDETIPTEAI